MKIPRQRIRMKRGFIMANTFYKVWEALSPEQHDNMYVLHVQHFSGLGICT